MRFLASEASSVASPTSRPEREKQPIQLPEKGGKSVIKLRSEADNVSWSFEFGKFCTVRKVKRDIVVHGETSRT